MAGTVIIGAGQAGGRTALLLAERGCRGPVTLVGAEPEPPYERPPLSKDMLADAMANGSAVPPSFLADAAGYERLGIRLLRGNPATAIDRADRRVVLADGTALPYERLVLATGAQPRQLPFPLERLHGLRTVADVRAIAARAAAASAVLVVGGGVIGLEVAATLRDRGLQVTVLEVGSRLLGRNFPAAIAARIAERHRAAGVDLRIGVRVRTMTEDAAGIRAVLSDGTTITADFAVAGIGVVPDTALARAAGLVVDDGVVVDRDLRTSDPAILAVGDVAALPGPDGRSRRVETWQNANLTAERAVATILGEPPPAAEVPWFWTDQYDLNVQLAGLTGPETAPETDGMRLVEQEASVAGGRLLLVLDGRRLAGAAAINAGRDMAACRRLLAAGAELPDAMLAAARFDGRAARALVTPASGRPVDA